MKMTTLLLPVLLLAACTTGAPPTDSPATAPPPTTAAPATDPPLTTPGPTPAGPPETAPPTPPVVETFPPFDTVVPVELMEQLVDEAAALAGVRLGDVQIVRAEAVTWSDATLGCPEEGEGGAQVLTDGYWVVLEAGGQEYDFRAAESGPPRLCPEGQGEPPSEGLPD